MSHHVSGYGKRDRFPADLYESAFVKRRVASGMCVCVCVFAEPSREGGCGSFACRRRRRRLFFSPCHSGSLEVHIGRCFFWGCSASCLGGSSA